MEAADLPVENVVGAFATAVDEDVESLCFGDNYRRLLLQTLLDRLAEAAAERLHEAVRRTYWGYAPDENLSPRELFAEHYGGCRPAVGYPSLPDLSLMFLLDRLIDMGEIGITLTANGMMKPHSAVAGLMFGHPAARHFSIGPIDERQFADYSARRGMPPEALRHCLAANLRPDIA